MQKNLNSSGNGWELYLNTPIIKLLGIDPKKEKVILKLKKNILFVEKAQENPENCSPEGFTKKLLKRGGGWALFLPLPILELMNITSPETDKIELEVDENTLLVRKCEL